MGEVYRAWDPRLERTVAIKISTRQFSERFEREARAVAALNHPHICTLYDIGPNYVVMEYIDGAPFKGQLPPDEALRLAIQIAEALDAAHRKGIAHRDLKPANVLVTKSGVKLLDFGLAKMRTPAVTDETVTNTITSEGTIVGTLRYMSPEQLQGKEADARSDIFAFGLTLYEMLTARRAFKASSKASLIGAILHTEPPAVSSLVPVAPPALDRVIHQCLAKDPDNRWESARDIAGEFRWIAEGGSQAGIAIPVAARRRSREGLAWLVAAALGVAAIGASAVAVRHLRETQPQQQAARFRLDLPEGVELSAYAPPLLSPDGSKILVVAGSGSKTQLWMRSLDNPAMRPLPGTEGATGGAVFSPDGRSVAFPVGGSVRRLDLAGGAIQTLCDLTGQSGLSAWSREGVILVSQQSVIQQVSASAGAPKPVTELAAGEQFHFYASFLPDGRHFLYYVSTGVSGAAAINAGSLDDPKFRKRLLQGTGPAKYAPPGWLLFPRDDILLAQPFDPAKLELSGEPVPVAERVGGNPNINAYAYSVSETGSLAWRLGAAARIMQLTWFDRSGKKLDTAGEPGEIANPVLAPDGKRVLIAIRDPATKTRDVWILDLARGVNSRLTFDPAEDLNPVWSPDGAYVVFSSSRKGHKDLYRKRADGTGGEEELLASDVDKNVDSLSPDGKYLLYNTTGTNKPVSTWALPLSGDHKPVLIAGDRYVATEGQFSSNGRWITYMSTESGRPQIFVQSAPWSGVPAGKWQVSSAGGLCRSGRPTERKSSSSPSRGTSSWPRR
jgi:Tol biopolymer transport system component